MMNDIKNNSGAITVYVVIACLFIIIIGIGAYIMVSNKQAAQLEQLNELQGAYQGNLTQEELYNNYNGGEIIPVLSEEQMLKMGSGEEIYIDGKIYTMTPEKTYVLKENWEENAEFTNKVAIVENGNGVIIKEYKVEAEKTYISNVPSGTESPYIGCYAKVGDVYGVIYADRAYGLSQKQWNDPWGKYKLTEANSSSLKNYYVLPTKYNGPFGEKDVLTTDDATGPNKEPRFYVMGLENINGTGLTWYTRAYDNATSIIGAQSPSTETYYELRIWKNKHMDYIKLCK